MLIKNKCSQKTNAHTKKTKWYTWMKHLYKWLHSIAHKFSKHFNLNETKNIQQPEIYGKNLNFEALIRKSNWTGSPVEWCPFKTSLHSFCFPNCCHSLSLFCPLSIAQFPQISIAQMTHSCTARDYCYNSTSLTNTVRGRTQNTQTLFIHCERKVTNICSFLFFYPCDFYRTLRFRLIENWFNTNE